MGKKYLLEIEENKDGNFAWSNFAPYTEPDMEQVRKEAYDKGYDDATEEIGSDEQAIAEKAYQRGLADAWEAARKVTQLRKYGGYGDCLEEVFGRHRVPWDVFDYSASECIEKIRQYEQEQEERIQVGDEVERILNGEVDSKAVFLEDNEGYYHCLFWTGCCFTTLSYPKEQFRKTGRHFDEIATVLEKMKES